MDTKKFNDAITSQVKMATREKPSYRAANIAISCLDLTSLTGKETELDIKKLCTKAKDSQTAAICVYPEYVALASQHLNNTDVALATVINFPDGANRNNGEEATIDTTRSDILHAIDDGANEIDIVVDYEKFKSMNINVENEIRDVLQAAKESCGADVKLKVILESGAFGQERELYDLAILALESGADFIKTSTGKHEDGGATLDAVAAMAMAVRNYNTMYDTQRGLKISGGVNGNNYAQYVDMVRTMLGQDYLTPSTFRFGASGVYDDLKMTLDTKDQIKQGANANKRPGQRANSY